MKFKKLLMVIIGTILCAFSFVYFLVPYNIAPGGVSGIAQIVNEIYPVNMSLFILIASFILLIFSFIFLNKEKTINLILGSILFPVFVFFIEKIYITYHFQVDNILLSSVFGGLIFGFGLGLVYREDYTTGGTDIICQILCEYFQIGRGISTIIVQAIILLFIAFTFGFSNFMYSLIVVYLISIVVDKVLLGISNSKSFYIITKKTNEVKEFIINDLHHGVTILDGKGAFSNNNQNVILTVIPTREYYKLKEGLKEIDKDAFFVANDAYEVGGGK